MEYSELNSRLELHKQWLENNDCGERLILSKVDLSNMVISNKDMRKCIVIDCDIRGANLSNTDLSGAVLDGSNLSYCSMIGTKINGASLKRTILNNTDVGIGQSTNRNNIYDILENDDDDMCKFQKTELTEEDLEDIGLLQRDKEVADIMNNIEFELDDDEDEEY